jgi:chemotaxis protein CheD
MTTHLIGIGGLTATRTSGATVKTLALGSCVAVIFLVPKTRCVGMAHIALPDSAIDERKRSDRPGYFADLAIPLLLAEIRKAGGCVDTGDLYVKIAGGANVLGVATTFDIGHRNVLAVRNILGRMGVIPVAEDVEGHISRTVSVHVDSGVVELDSPGKKKWTI